MTSILLGPVYSLALRFALPGLVLLSLGMNVAQAALPATNPGPRSGAIGTASPLEPRIYEYTYSPDQVFRIYARVGQVTHIALQPGEGLRLKPKLGDSLQWRISGGPQHWFVKPLQEGIETSATLVSNLAVYQLQLISVRSGQPWFQKISFEHPEWGEEQQLLQESPTNSRAALQAGDAPGEQAGMRLNPHNGLPPGVATSAPGGIAPSVTAPNGTAPSVTALGTTPTATQVLEVEEIDADCDIEGDAPFRPRAVLSNKLFTYVKLGSGPVPAIFALDGAGKPSLVNHTFKGRWVVIGQPRASLLLKLGAQEVTIRWQRGTP